MRKLAIALMALVLVALAAPAVVPIGMKAEWDAYWLKMLDIYRDDQLAPLSGNGRYNMPLVMDTMTIPQGRLCDTFNFRTGQNGNMIWYPFIYPDVESEGIGVNVYAIWNSGTTIPFYPPDSTPIQYAGAVGPYLILWKGSGDTSSSTGVTVVGFYKPPRKSW